jgi:Fic family protein
MKSLTLDYLESLTFTADDVATLRRLGEYRGRQELLTYQRPEVLADLRTRAVIESSESSNRLEGIVAPKARIEALVREATAPRNRNEREIAGYRDALSLIHETAVDMPFSPNLLLQLHGMLYRHQAAEGGRWKMTDNQIVERDEKGEVVRVRFTPVAAVATGQAIADLTAQYRTAVEESPQDPLVLAPLAVLDFLCIHPFRDGNGRVGRLLTLMLLYRHGYEVGRYVSLERIVEQSRESYYETLQASSTRWHEAGHDSGPWLRYFWGVLLNAYREFEERVGQIGGGKGSKSRQVRAAVERKITPFSISELERDCPGVSRETVRLVLRRMRDEGALTLEGRGRGARWRKVEG